MFWQITGNLIPPPNNNLWNPQIPNQYWLQFTKVDGLTVNGGGSLDGQGASWWNMCKNVSVKLPFVHLSPALFHNDLDTHPHT